MKMSDVVFVGFILMLLVLVSHYSMLIGFFFAGLMCVINFLDVKRPTSDGNR